MQFRAHCMQLDSHCKMHSDALSINNIIEQSSSSKRTKERERQRENKPVVPGTRHRCSCCYCWCCYCCSVQPTFSLFWACQKKMAQGKQAAPFQINITGEGTKLYLIAVNRYVWIFANSFTFLLFTTNTNKGTATLKINTYVCTQSRVL